MRVRAAYSANLGRRNRPRSATTCGGWTLVDASLQAEALVLTVVNEALSALTASDSLTPGVDNLLQGVADLHETFVYLLQQRFRVSYEYAR
jgi:hypothetical protein